ncbi:MAG TPA: YggS family pyridoxal phosphate-dependent enzyme [Thiolapillus brandeum]|uniref:Pyridoxal phosphate homeostasis protein n=1 Tax=Thiolapillus brandeum TaxID=1076588 RepID=A0A831RWL1_9GAMM|nr:YggS family pyridoxal phosphate-dependent enzyme [Thiolapillus brandeum]
MSKLQQRLSQVQAQIRRFALSCDRDPTGVRLIAVSKTRPASDIREVWKAGQKAFAENYLQDALQKIPVLHDCDIEWHFIGRIQSNKTRPIAENFAWVHTLSSLKHGRRLSEQRPEGLPPINICVQLNLTGEASKSGISADELAPLLEKLADLPHLRLRGLMTMPPASATTAEQHEVFSRLHGLLTEMNRQGHGLDSLSMGMSGDMQAAICEGATMVRIGTAIFGPRTQQ